MKNITLSVEEEVLEGAQRYAAERDTTVAVLVRQLLTEIAGYNERLRQAKEELRRLSENSTARLGPDYKWNREELYEERIFPRHQRSDLRRGGGEG
jgi:hypothetical protein